MLPLHVEGCLRQVPILMQIVEATKASLRKTVNSLETLDNWPDNWSDLEISNFPSNYFIHKKVAGDIADVQIRLVALSLACSVAILWLR